MVIDLDAAKDGDDFAVKFSDDDIVCVHTTIDTHKYTTVNSVARPAATPSAVGVSPATCTGGWTAWTTATGWNSISWTDATTTSIINAVNCFTVGTDADDSLTADVVITTKVDTFTTAGATQASPPAVTAASLRTVTETYGLKSGSLLLWLFIILLLGGGGGAAYYFMVLAPAAV